MIGLQDVMGLRVLVLLGRALESVGSRFLQRLGVWVPSLKSGGFGLQLCG